MSDSNNLISFGIFPGQGSQFVGMGQELYQQQEEAQEIFNIANKLLGISLTDLCFKGPEKELTLTKHVQPAILSHSIAAFRVSGAKLSAACGHSLGEYSALVAAGVIEFSDAVQLVHKRGSYMQEAVPSGQGKMIAVLGVSDADINQALSQVDQGVAEVANLNSEGQVVVAGDIAGVDSFIEILSAKKVIPLNVSAPFHCSLMKPAEVALTKDLQATTFSEPAFPVFANVSGERIPSGEAARELLIQQVCSPVRWVDCVRNLIKEINPQTAIEFGPGQVLSKLMKRIDRSVKCSQVSKPEDLATP